MESIFRNAIFNFWVSVNYNLIKQSLEDSNTLNCDAIHDAIIDTYLELNNLDEVTLEEISEIFNRHYRKASRRIVDINFRYIPFEDNIIEFIVNSNCLPEDSFRYNYSDDIIKLTKTILTKEEYRLLTIYVWSDNMTLDNLSLYTGVHRSTLFKQINNIKNKVKESITNK